jgi:hypothetical protein
MSRLVKSLLVVLGVFLVSLAIMTMGDYTAFSPSNTYQSGPASVTEGYETSQDLVEASKKAANQVANLVTMPSTVSVDPVSSNIVAEQTDAAAENFEAMFPRSSLGFGMVGGESNIDRFSQVNSFTPDGLTCESANMSTDRGMMCLSPELVTLLKTRGGNAAGGALPQVQTL